jgi:hypothetical protein
MVITLKMRTAKNNIFSIKNKEKSKYMLKILDYSNKLWTYKINVISVFKFLKKIKKN